MAISDQELVRIRSALARHGVPLEKIDRIGRFDDDNVITFPGKRVVTLDAASPGAAGRARVDEARSVRIEDEIARRGIRLAGRGPEREGPCPKCGGDDRFSINTKKQTWNCRQCKTEHDPGDVIGFVRWLDGVEFVHAVEMLTPQWRNGQDREPSCKKIIAARFEYEDENGSLLFQAERVEFQRPDGSFILKDGKKQKKFQYRRKIARLRQRHGPRPRVAGPAAQRRCHRLGGRRRNPGTAA